VPLLVLILALGVFPRFVFGISDEAVSSLVHVLGG
jgi:hypothetical protein